MSPNQTPNDRLFAAASSGKVDALMQALSDGADLNAVDDKGWTAVMLAARFHHKHVIEALIKLGARLATRDAFNRDCIELLKCMHEDMRGAAHEIGQMIRAQAAYESERRALVKQAETFARLLTKLIGGRINGSRHNEINDHIYFRSTYRGMQCRAHTNASYFDLWVQNFRFEDLNVCMNLEREDNRTHPREFGAWDAWADGFSDALPIYTYSSAEGKRAADVFFGIPDNRRDLAEMKLGRFEWLVFTNGQARLRSQTQDLNMIQARIEALARIYQRHHSPSKPPLISNKYSMRLAAPGNKEQHHHFGGPRRRALQCTHCESPLIHFVSFDLSDPRLKPIGWKGKTLATYICASCSLYETSSLTCLRHNDRTLEILQQSESWAGSYDPPEELPAKSIILNQPARAPRRDASRIGGSADWAQTDQTPDCPICRSRMDFFAQLASTNQIMIGADMGMAYFFVCVPCKTSAVVIQST